jgi:LmbE family N-acetylglucosaminyl deacetylase
MTTLKLTQPTAEIYVPDGTPEPEAISRTTHMAVGAHHDDLEIMAAHGILECFARQDRWFFGVVVSDGAGSPRDLDYKNYSDEQMKKVRRLEQKKAAFVGEYGAQALVDHKSSSIKDPKNTEVVGDLVALLRAARPSVVYTHNLADKHDTHVGVALKVIKACRALPADESQAHRMRGLARSGLALRSRQGRDARERPREPAGSSHGGLRFADRRRQTL